MSGPRRWESVVETQIRQAQQRGDFDGLPGQGKPIPGAGEPDDELWWVKGLLKREGLETSALLPASLRLRKQIEDLPATVRGLRTEAAVRAAVDDLNERIAAWVRTPSGPQVVIRPVDAEEVLTGWRAARPAVPPPASEPGSPARRRRRWRPARGRP
ncbi:MAG: DUF1992 domain-containing protein, partial [Mycobacteriales bacterium]